MDLKEMIRRDIADKKRKREALDHIIESAEAYLAVLESEPNNLSDEPRSHAEKRIADESSVREIYVGMALTDACRKFLHDFQGNMFGAEQIAVELEAGGYVHTQKGTLKKAVSNALHKARDIEKRTGKGRGAVTKFGIPQAANRTGYLPQPAA